MAHYDFSRSSLLKEQYMNDMEPIAAALQEESQEEREERLGLVLQAWPLTCTCFHSELEMNEVPTYAPVALVHP